MAYLFTPDKCPNQDHPEPGECGLCGHVTPPAPIPEGQSPLIIVGEEFPNWRDVGRTRAGRRTLIEVTTDAGWGQALMGNLGGYVPGILDDGTAVEFYVSQVNWSGLNEYKALLIPEVHARKEYL